jgi:uncharacterized protein (DUF433 family)
MPTNVLGNGIYTLSEAASLVGVSPNQARAWFAGWPKSQSKGVLKPTDYTAIMRPDLVSFLDLVDVLVVGQLRLVGASMPSIRKAYRAISKKLDSPHPFGRKELYADSNGKLFIYAAEETGDDILAEIVTGQAAFPTILLKYLKRIDYDPQTHFARRLNIGKNVVLDAKRRYGKPIVKSAGMATKLLAGAYFSNKKDADAVADWYGVTSIEVMDAVAFESGPPGIAA